MKHPRTTRIPDPESNSLEAKGRPHSDDLCVLHMLVPVEARRRAKVAAIESGLRSKTYITRLMLIAAPFGCATVDSSVEDDLS